MSETIDVDAIEAELARMQDRELSRGEVDEIIRGLGDIIGIEELALDEEGTIELVVDEQVTLTMIHLPNVHGVVAAAVMPDGVAEDDAILRELLQTNMSWVATQGGTFVYLPPRVALCRLIPLASGDAARLDQELAMFVKLAKAWQDDLSDQIASGKNEDSPDATGVHGREGHQGLRV